MNSWTIKPGGNLTMTDLNAYTADWLPGLDVSLARCATVAIVAIHELPYYM